MTPNSSPALTIAVPTYNRAGPLASLVEALRPACEAGLIELLVLDDGSTDATSERVGALAFRGFRFQRNPKNLGYGLNFCRLFAECRTEYMLVTADDDEIDVSALEPLIRWAELRRPVFASSQWLKRDGLLYRGKRTDRPIAPRDFRVASGHAPGLLYHVETCRSRIARIESLISARDSMASFYPQVVLVAQLMVDGECRWYPGCVVTEGRALPSQLLDAAGRPYGDPLSRIEQLIALDRILATLRSETAGPSRRRVGQMIRQNARGFYWSARESFRALGSDSAARGLDGSALLYLFKHLLPFAALARGAGSMQGKAARPPAPPIMDLAR